VRATYKVVRDVDNDRDIARRERDALLDPLKERMVQYRLALELEYETGHPFRDTVPELTPTAGSTPDAVTAQGEWDETTQEAVITWTPSTNPNLASYLIRFSAGGTYDSGDAKVAGTTPVGTEELRTTDGLLAPGDVAAFKVFVTLGTGNTAGSNTIVISRP
jgi:hypothetical protein